MAYFHMDKGSYNVKMQYQFTGDNKLFDLKEEKFRVHMGFV